MIDGWGAPLPVNGPYRSASRPSPPGRVHPAADAPPVYLFLETLPEDAVIVEFPFGHPPWELRYVYNSSVHLRRLLNGYSGGFPPSYDEAAALLSRPDAAWRLLRERGVTHAIVHESGFAGDGQRRVTTWLAGQGAHQVGRFRTDALFARPR